ncbi:MAG: hypothetical protein KKB31_04190 [Nanoarchaeota archaeon]|nr:hypothetical protein [Nanoarchaeota archaeon]
MELKRNQTIIILGILVIGVLLIGPKLGLFVGVPWDEWDESHWVQIGDTFVLTTDKNKYTRDWYAWEIRNTLSEVTAFESQGKYLEPECKINTPYGTFYGQTSYRNYPEQGIINDKTGTRCEAPLAYQRLDAYVAPKVTWYFSVPQSCNTDADTNCDGIVSRDELGNFITKWISGAVTRDKLGEAIVAWMG